MIEHDMDVAFELADRIKSEVVAVLGRNGVGKTTLVRSIIGLAPPRRGRGRWSREKIVELFPNLAHRLRQLGGKLSGGEQQMLAAGRALGRVIEALQEAGTSAFSCHAAAVNSWKRPRLPPKWPVYRLGEPHERARLEQVSF